jgi:hypothetical protein
MGTEQFESIVVPWAERDRKLEARLRELYAQHLNSWIAMQGDRKFGQKWHVGREMLDWFYEQHLIGADEFEALNVKHSRPGKPGYDIEMYRIIWITAGRASDQVARISLAPRMGPSKGYASGTRSVVALKAEREIKYGEGGWLYAYGYEEALKHSQMLAEVPLLKVGHTSGSYSERIGHQVRGTEIPDSPRILRAYQVTDSFEVESAVHRRLESEGCHHIRAGGSEWFRVDVSRLDEVVGEVIEHLSRGRAG